MLENLINLVKEHAGEAIINNPAIPNHLNEDAIQHTASSIFDQLKSGMADNGPAMLSSLFNSGSISQNPMIGQIAGGVAQSLMNKFGIDQQQASGIAQNLIPQVMNSLANKTNDPNDNSFDMQGILGSLGGGAAGSLLSGLGNMFS